MSKSITIGKGDVGAVKLDIPRLIVSRLLVTAASGGGKSWLLRKILEDVSKTVQTLVIDTEGEFATLRELRDMVLAGPSGEVPAEPRSASLLCRRLMEMNLSAVIDVSELSRTDKRTFVANFVNTLIDLPRSLWRPCIVAVDETHEYAAEKEPSESSKALALLASKGRKRGYCLLGATQRLSKLDKDVAAELKCQFIGQMQQDVDVRRAADVLGFSKDRWREIIDLSPPGKEGEFFAFGPALNHRGVVKFRAGDVQTTHPRAGHGRLAEPPAPSAKIKGVLDELKDLPQQAEAEIRDLAAAKSKIRELEKQLKSQPTTKPVEVHSRNDAATIKRLRSALEQAMNVIAKINAQGFEKTTIDKKQVMAAVEAASDQIVKLVESKLATRNTEFEKLKREANQLLAKLQKVLADDVSVSVDVRHNEPFTMKPSITSTPRRASSAPKAKGERAILIAVAQHSEGVDRNQLTQLTGYKRSTRDAYIQRLAASGFIHVNGDGITVTEAGVAELGGDFDPLPTGDALREHWLGRLPEGERKVLEALAAQYPDPLTREQITEATEYQRSTRDAYIQRLAARKLVEIVGRGEVRMSEMLVG